MKTYTVKLNDADLAIGRKVNVAVCERIFDAEGKALSDALIGTVDAEVVGIGAHWSDQPHGESGRYYDVQPVKELPHPSRAGREIVLG